MKNIFLAFSIIMMLGASSTDGNQKEVMKVMTYNVWNGFDWGKDLQRKEKCIRWISKQKPDVLALQELCGYDEDGLKEDAMKWGHPYVQLLKNEGYATALTSNQPIEFVEKRLAPFWHGMLHCQTYGIDFFVVHLSPADSDFRLREARMVTQSIKESKIDNCIVLGDFNAQSPLDAYFMSKSTTLKMKYAPKSKDEKYSNLREGNFDYSVISEFLASPLIDLGLKNYDLQETSYTFPTPILIGKFANTKTSIVQNRTRIDYILASPILANSCEKYETFNKHETHDLSDHYPVMAEFRLAEEPRK